MNQEQNKTEAEIESHIRAPQNKGMGNHNSKLVTSRTENIQHSGKATIPTQIGHRSYKIEYHVMDIVAEAIIGRNFIHKHEVIINLKSRTLWIKDEPISLQASLQTEPPVGHTTTPVNKRIYKTIYHPLPNPESAINDTAKYKTGEISISNQLSKMNKNRAKN